jgi:Tfp pilus assembly protein PilX
MKTMGQINDGRRRDRGSITVYALLILALLTLLGLGVLTSTTSDTRAAQNVDIYRKNFDRAEAAVRGGMQDLQNVVTADATGVALRNFTMLGLSNGVTNGVLPADIATNGTYWSNANSVAVLDANCRYYIVNSKIEGSLDATSSQIRTYVVYGMSNQQNGMAIVRVGYRVKLMPVVG